MPLSLLQVHPCPKTQAQYGSAWPSFSRTFQFSAYPTIKFASTPAERCSASKNSEKSPAIRVICSIGRIAYVSPAQTPDIIGGLSSPTRRDAGHGRWYYSQAFALLLITVWTRASNRDIRGGCPVGPLASRQFPFPFLILHSVQWVRWNRTRGDCLAIVSTMSNSNPVTLHDNRRGVVAPGKRPSGLWR